MNKMSYAGVGEFFISMVVVNYSYFISKNKSRVLKNNLPQFFL